MPREQINYPDLAFKAQQAELPKPPDAPHSDWGPWNESALHVGWQGLGNTDATTRHGIGWVQVGLEVDQEYARFAMANCNGATHDRTVMWTPVMSPAEVDSLIATLKRARRKAFKPQG